MCIFYVDIIEIRENLYLTICVSTNKFLKRDLCQGTPVISIFNKKYIYYFPWLIEDIQMMSTKTMKIDFDN